MGMIEDQTEVGERQEFDKFNIYRRSAVGIEDISRTAHCVDTRDFRTVEAVMQWINFLVCSMVRGKAAGSSTDEGKKNRTPKKQHSHLGLGIFNYGIRRLHIGIDIGIFVVCVQLLL